MRDVRFITQDMKTGVTQTNIWWLIVRRCSITVHRGDLYDDETVDIIYHFSFIIGADYVVRGADIAISLRKCVCMCVCGWVSGCVSVI